MTSVFIGGSRKVSRLNSAITERVDNIIEKDYDVLIGDANGADKAVQGYLAKRGYRKVTVFYMEGICRNNIGKWETQCVAAAGRKKDFSYYATKDVEMAREATYGFMLWDGNSKGSLNNIMNLLGHGKAVLVYFAPEIAFYTLNQAGDLQQLLAKCDRDVLRKLGKDVHIPELFPAEQVPLESM